MFLVATVSQSYSGQLSDDPIVHTHLSALYDTLLEQNLIRCGTGSRTASYEPNCECTC